MMKLLVALLYITGRTLIGPVLSIWNKNIYSMYVLGGERS